MALAPTQAYKPWMGGLEELGGGGSQTWLPTAGFNPQFMDPNEGPVPPPGGAGPSTGTGGWLDILKSALPGLINAGIDLWGNKRQEGNFQTAVSQSGARPANIQSMFGNVAVDPTTGLTISRGPGPGAFGGAAPELINAFNQLNDQGAIAQEAGGRLGLLRQLAQPDEARATQGLEQRLFSQGRLGGTGGAVQQEALMRAQSQADLARQLESMNWANQNALQRFGAAGNLVGSGQAQQNIDFGQTRDLGQLSAYAGRTPSADLLAALAGAKGTTFSDLLGSLGGNQAGGMGGTIVDILSQIPGLGGIKPSGLSRLGEISNLVGNQIGGGWGSGLSAGGNLLAGIENKDWGRAAGGAGNLLQQFGGSIGGKTGGFLGGLGGVLGGLGSLFNSGSSAAKGNPLAMAGLAQGLSGLTSGAITGAAGGGGLAGGFSGALQGLSGIGSGAGAAGSGSGIASSLGSLSSGLGTALGGVGAVGAFLSLGDVMNSLFGDSLATFNKHYGTDMRSTFVKDAAGRQAWTEEFNRQRSGMPAWSQVNHGPTSAPTPFNPRRGAFG